MRFYQKFRFYSNDIILLFTNEIFFNYNLYSMPKPEQKKTKNTQKEKKRKIERLYEKKPIIEFIVAVLSIPSILLLLLLNLKALTNNQNAKPTPTPSRTISGPGT